MHIEAMEKHQMPKKSLNGKSVIITGANRGIGLQVALKLAKEGARLILGCRDMARAAEAKVQVCDLHFCYQC